MPRCLAPTVNYPLSGRGEAVGHGLSRPPKPFPPTASPVTGKTLIAFLNAPDWPASRQVLEAQQEPLLSAGANEMLAGFIEQAQAADNSHLVEMLEMHRTLLQRCKEIGIEAAFAELENVQSG